MSRDVALVIVRDLNRRLDLVYRHAVELPGIEQRRHTTGLHDLNLRGTLAEIITRHGKHLISTVGLLCQVQARHLRVTPLSG